MGRLRLALAFAVLSTSSGCFSVPPGVSLEPPEVAPISVARGAWLAPVQVTDAHAEDPIDVQRTLTLVIATYAEKARYFPRVNLLPGNPGDGDVMLHFEFDQYQLQRQVHPAYVPGYLLTLGLYVLFGGPIDRDFAMLTGRLRVEDSAGNVLAESRGHFEERHTVSLYSADYQFPSSMKARTDLVRALLDDAVGQLAGKVATSGPLPASGAP